MPKRTNQFQSLMTQIQAALHGKKARVEESPMIYNYDSEAETEVDILVTFDIGGTSYRTAIECQDRSRCAGPGWISELRTKRDACRLDKIIAVHSKGFTASAKTMAEKYGVETLTPKEIREGNDLLDKINPFTGLLFRVVKCKFPQGIVFAFEKGGLPEKADPDSSRLAFPDDNTMSISEFQKALSEMVRSIWVSKEYDLTGTSFADIEEDQIQDNVLVEISFPNGAELRFSDGTCLSVILARTSGQVSIQTKMATALKHLSPKHGVLTTHAECDLMGKKASITLAQEEGKKGQIGLCIAWDGGTMNAKTQVDSRLVGNIRLTITKL